MSGSSQDEESSLELFGNLPRLHSSLAWSTLFPLAEALKKVLESNQSTHGAYQYLSPQSRDKP